MFSLKEFFKSAFSVDCVIFGFDEGDLKVLLIQRGEEPYKDKWALPGNLVFPDEDLNFAAKRVLKELTGLTKIYMEQVHSFGRIDRHPLGRVVTVAYYSLVLIGDYKVRTASFAKNAEWHSVNKLPELAFDHEEIIEVCRLRLKKKVRNQPIGFELLPKKFTLTHLQHLYEAILETEFDKRNFRKKILKMDLLQNLQEAQNGVAHRPPRLYMFDRKRYDFLKAKGFNFEL